MGWGGQEKFPLFPTSYFITKGRRLKRERVGARVPGAQPSTLAASPCRSGYERPGPCPPQLFRGGAGCERATAPLRSPRRQGPPSVGSALRARRGGPELLEPRSGPSGSRRRSPPLPELHGGAFRRSPPPVAMVSRPGVLWAVAAAALALVGRRALPAPVVRCEPCDARALQQCKPLQPDCAERVREPGCGCCLTCALRLGQPCGIYTERCGAGLNCQPRQEEARPLQALLEGRGFCTNATAGDKLRAFLLPGPHAAGKGLRLGAGAKKNAKSACTYTVVLIVSLSFFFNLRSKSRTREGSGSGGRRGQRRLLLQQFSAARAGVVRTVWVFFFFFFPPKEEEAFLVFFAFK